MSTHTFRNPNLIQQLDYRDFIREHCPDAREGFVALDLDLLLRHYGPQYNSDRIGKFRLIEIKRNGGQPTNAQNLTFGLVDLLLQFTHPLLRPRYEGYYVVRTNEPWPESPYFVINGTETLFPEDFIDWLNGRLDVPPFDLGDVDARFARAIT